MSAWRNPPWWPTANLRVCFDETEPQCCPMGCGGMTDDPLGGPCEECYGKLQ